MNACVFFEEKNRPKNKGGEVDKNAHVCDSNFFRNGGSIFFLYFIDI